MARSRRCKVGIVLAREQLLRHFASQTKAQPRRHRVDIAQHIILPYKSKQTVVLQSETHYELWE